MRSFHRNYCRCILAALTAAAMGMPIAAAQTDDEKPKDKPAAKKKAVKPAAESAETPAEKEAVRWGKRRGETEEQYDKRYSSLLKRVKEETLNNSDAADVKMFRVDIGSFIVRTDISKEFTADTAMYMEMLHREYSEAYSKLLGGVPSQVKEKIEVVVFKDRQTYVEKAKGMAGSGGVFMQSQKFGDRDPNWPALHYRLMQFTGGVEDFAHWEKGTLKHEAAHMELTMRMGLGVEAPRWWNEGHASVFEFWDFDKSVDENFAEVPFRGRYAPAVRRAFGTDRWKDLDYIWNVDAQTWAAAMTAADGQGFLNYAQSWSLAAYMMNEGRKGRADFQKIYTVSCRVGSPAQATSRVKSGPRMGRVGRVAAGGASQAWDDAFPKEDRAKLEKNWREWVTAKLPKDKENPHEAVYLMRQGFSPSSKDKLAPATEEDGQKYGKQLKKYEENTKKEVQK